MGHRIREAMRSGNLAPMGGIGGVVEADETFTGRKEGSIKRRGLGHKNAVLSLVDRNSGQVRSFHVDGTSAADIVPIIKANVAKETAMMTDEALAREAGTDNDPASFDRAFDKVVRPAPAVKPQGGEHRTK
jgi:hypothetical protein